MQLVRLLVQQMRRTLNPIAEEKTIAERELLRNHLLFYIRLHLTYKENSLYHRLT